MKWNPEPLTQQEKKFRQFNFSDEGGRKKIKKNRAEGEEEQSSRQSIYSLSLMDHKRWENIIDVFKIKPNIRFWTTNTGKTFSVATICSRCKQQIKLCIFRDYLKYTERQQLSKLIYGHQKWIPALNKNQNQQNNIISAWNTLCPTYLTQPRCSNSNRKHIIPPTWPTKSKFHWQCLNIPEQPVLSNGGF